MARNYVKELKQSIAHWNVMIQWVKGRKLADAHERPSMLKMEMATGQNWTAQFCPLCQAVKKACDILVVSLPFCRKHCPLGSCGDDSAWQEVHEADTWVNWLAAAENKMLPALEAALKLAESQFPEPPTGEQWHNPGKLSPHVVGVQGGWRLLLVSEVEGRHRRGALTAKDVEIYWHSGWGCTIEGSQISADSLSDTYRTRLTFQEFRDRCLADPKLYALARINYGTVTDTELQWFRDHHTVFTVTRPMDEHNACFLVGNTLGGHRFCMVKNHNYWSSGVSPRDSLERGDIRLDRLPDDFPVSK